MVTGLVVNGVATPGWFIQLTLPSDHNEFTNE